jgi:peptide/nickel transport system substrate-binding protein
MGCARSAPGPDEARVIVASAPEALDPRFATSAIAGRLSELVACPLVTIGDDLRPLPLLAESIDEQEDGSYLVNVREGVFFHDGRPVTADDVRFSLLSMKDPALASPHRARLDKLTDVVIEGPRTARLVLSAPHAGLLVDLRGYGILSRAACEPDPAACRMKPVGAGPYAVATVTDGGDRLGLVAHDRSPLGPVSIRALDVRVVRDNTARLLAVLDGGVDLVASEMLPTDYDAIERSTGARLVRGPGIGFTYFALNVRGPQDSHSPEVAHTRRALADPRVREALARAVDIDLIVETKLRGRAERATGLLPLDHWAKERALPLVDLDVERANTLFDEAGFTRRADGTRFSFEILTTADRTRRSIALLFADAWRAVGIDVEVRVRDFAALYADVQQGAFDGFSLKWTPVVDPDLMSWVFSSAHIPAPGRAGGNRSGYANTEVDDALTGAQRSRDPDERRTLYQSVERALVRDLPLIPLWFEDEILVAGPDLKDFRIDRIASLLPLARARIERAP